MICWGKCWKYSDINCYKLVCKKKIFKNCLELFLRILLVVNIKYVSECISVLFDVVVYISWYLVVCVMYGDLMSVYMKVNIIWFCIFCCFLEESLELEIINVWFLKCLYGLILINVILWYELWVGKFFCFGLVVNMDICI